MRPEPHPSSKRPEPEASPRRLRASLPLAFLFLTTPLLLASCQERSAFGLSDSRLQSILAGTDPAPILALDARQLDQFGDYGPASYYYLARWLESRCPAAGASSVTASDAGSMPQAQAALPSLDAASERIRFLLRRAYDRNGGLIRREAGRALAAHLRDDGAAGIPGAWDALASFDEAFHVALGPDWVVDRSYLDALDGSGRNTELSAATAALRVAFPAETTDDADALLYFEAAAAQRTGRSGWAALFRRLFFERPTSDWTGRALDFVEALEPPTREISRTERTAVRMRLAVQSRDYGVAYRESAGATGLIFGSAASPLLVADAGKAYLYSGQSAEGIRRFALLESTARHEAAVLGDTDSTGRTARVAWTAAFYRARFYRALERWRDAATLFETLADSASAPTDADAARWYAVDCSSKIRPPRSKKERPADIERGARRATLDALERAAASWRDPRTYADLVDSLFRDALEARDWQVIDRLAASPACHTTPAMEARCAYVAARGLELGLSGTIAEVILRGKEDLALHVPASSLAGDMYRAIMNDPSLPLHYRALAAWRLDEEPSLLPPERPAPTAPADTDPLESFLAGFIPYGLSDLLYKETANRLALIDRESLRRLAVMTAQAGHPDISMRLIVLLMGRADWDPRLSDYQLLYPRPYLAEIRSLRSRLDLPEPLLLGLVRSESLFRADIVSAAGAVGLAQLMPATAAQIARSLGITHYDLTDPKDNLRFGVVYFSDLLSETGHPLEALWAYNAGRTRMRKWNAEGSDLPDDLKLEALGFEETRQYGRNIVQAAVMYGELYYGMRAATITGEIVEGERSWLEPAAQTVTGP